tara:strand:- start:158 stop:328 length:171 start_codon:yes stop_codon:yes gene_type:complete
MAKRIGIPYAVIDEETFAHHICPFCKERIPFKGKGKDSETYPLDGYREHLDAEHPE